MHIVSLNSEYFDIRAFECSLLVKLPEERGVMVFGCWEVDDAMVGEISS